MWWESQAQPFVQSWQWWITWRREVPSEVHSSWIHQGGWSPRLGSSPGYGRSSVQRASRHISMQATASALALRLRRRWWASQIPPFRLWEGGTARPSCSTLEPHRVTWQQFRQAWQGKAHLEPRQGEYAHQPLDSSVSVHSRIAQCIIYSYVCGLSSCLISFLTGLLTIMRPGKRQGRESE